jgi:undecaprenyl-diphosphatase
MDLLLLFKAALLGVLEGLTEFIPVSSTGHLILAVDLLGFEGPKGKVFEIVVQLGAILAVCWLYRAKLFSTLLGLGRDPVATRFAANILIAFLPAAAVGVLAHKVIKEALFNPWVVSFALVIGGVAILVIERLVPRAPIRSVDEVTWLTALKIGICQIVAMIPGVSRSGATIMGARIFGVERSAAAEFSFFLAIPTMAGATAYDLYKNWATLSLDGGLVIAVGFVAAFLSALAVVHAVVGFVSRRGFAPFAWYRILVGVAMLSLLTWRTFG